MDKPRHGGHLAAAALKKEGVDHLFTLSGGHIAPIYDGCVDEGRQVSAVTAVGEADEVAEKRGVRPLAALVGGDAG